MKILIRILIFISLFSFKNLLYAEINISYLDMEKVFNESIAGKMILKELEEINKKNISKFKKIEENLKNEELQISSQKNILTEAEYKKKILSFQDKVSKYKDSRNKSITDLKNKRDKAINNLSRSVNKILAEYSVEKEISLIIPKKNIIIGKTELEITNDILVIVDKNIKKININ